MGLRNMDIESTVIERFDSAIFSWYLHNINSIQAATAEKHSDTRGYGTYCRTEENSRFIWSTTHWDTQKNKHNYTIVAWTTWHLTLAAANPRISNKEPIATFSLVLEKRTRKAPWHHAMASVGRRAAVTAHWQLKLAAMSYGSSRQGEGGEA